MASWWNLRVWLVSVVVRRYTSKRYSVGLAYPAARGNTL